MQDACHETCEQKLGTIHTEHELKNVAAMRDTSESDMVSVSDDPNLATFRRVKP